MARPLKAETRKSEILENYYHVLIREGFEGASIGKIAKRMNIHPSLIIHYFKTKDNMAVELVDLLIDKYLAPEFLRFEPNLGAEERLEALLDTVFSLEWSRTVDPGVHFGFYYLSFRNPTIRRRFEDMFRRFRDYLAGQLCEFKKEGLVKVADTRQAADAMVTLMEGLEFHAHFLSENRPFDEFAGFARKLTLQMLRGERLPEQLATVTWSQGARGEHDS
jgi:AcrR family transcriptional regulator